MSREEIKRHLGGIPSPAWQALAAVLESERAISAEDCASPSGTPDTRAYNAGRLSRIIELANLLDDLEKEIRA